MEECVRRLKELEKREDGIYDRLAIGETWRAEHDGRINAYWEAQFKLNTETHHALESLRIRITAVEKRVMLIAGGASVAGGAMGAIVGAVISKAIGGP